MRPKPTKGCRASEEEELTTYLNPSNVLNKIIIKNMIIIIIIIINGEFLILS
jgi:hypothetical protein